MIIQYLFVFACFVIDGAIEAVFNINYGIDHMYFVPCLGVCSLVITIRKMNFTDAMTLSVLSGMFYDFFYTKTFLTYTIVFVLLCLLVKAWTKHLGESLIESVIICICAVFAMQLLVYGYMLFLGKTQISFYAWITNRMFLTIVVNSVLVLVLFFFANLRDHYLQKRELRIRKEEKLFLFKARK